MVAEPAALEAAVDGPRICQPGGQGLFLPFGGESEQGWDTRLKVLLYVVGLIYCFLGVSIVADMFMNAIERITSQKKKVKLAGTDRQITVQVWNETVANLTLMALGSSAPEILLALNDVLKNRFFEGKLGPSTIVGSAAFNLFCIIAVCINSVPNGETRRIKEMNVFVVTAAWSIFAYLWLLFIVTFNSSDVCSNGRRFRAIAAHWLHAGHVMRMRMRSRRLVAGASAAPPPGPFAGSSRRSSDWCWHVSFACSRAAEGKACPSSTRRPRGRWSTNVSRTTWATWRM
mmetsp:Transcript_104750/g.337679  ORF Transcript_104750/g.337679 Transcript_104750/m.337679 type:complete len:287 (+) Transcript_104750:164-1024(+)